MPLPILAAATTLIPLAVQAVPALMKLFGSPLAEGVTAKLPDIAQKVFGTTDPEAIKLKIQQDQSALDRFRAELEADTAELQAVYADLASARNQTIALSQLEGAARHMAWGAPAMTVIVTIGFFLIISLMARLDFADSSEFQKTVLISLTGALAAGFQQALNYWLGSTRQSKDKDGLIAALSSTSMATAATATTAVAAGTGAGTAAPANGGKKLFR